MPWQLVCCKARQPHRPASCSMLPVGVPPQRMPSCGCMLLSSLSPQLLLSCCIAPQALCRRLEAWPRLQQLSPKELALLASAVASAGVRHEALFTSIARVGAAGGLLDKCGQGGCGTRPTSRTWPGWVETTLGLPFNMAKVGAVRGMLHKRGPGGCGTRSGVSFIGKGNRGSGRHCVCG